MSKVTKLCSWCKKPHVVRQADLNRGWGKFCSKKCKAMEQENVPGKTLPTREIGMRMTIVTSAGL